MSINQNLRLRLAILSTLVKNSPQTLGRTALMKLAYFLQELRKVPLGYNFELYNYGPYDSSVLSDLSQSVTAETMDSKVVYYSSGYGYEYTPKAAGYEKLVSQVGDELAKYKTDIEWALAEYGTCSASRLELLSTIIFADREMNIADRSVEELGRRVKEIKPHFTEQAIGEAIQELKGKGLVQA